jgi:hypothetical protein
MRKSEILLKAMQISGIGNVDENKAKLVLAFVEKLETFGMGLSLREIEATGNTVTKQIQQEMAKNGMVPQDLSNQLKAMTKETESVEGDQGNEVAD